MNAPTSTLHPKDEGVLQYLIGQLEQCSDHIRQLDDLEHPRAARRLARRLTSCSDRAMAISRGSVDVQGLQATCSEGFMLLDDASRLLVREGVRRTITPELFGEIDDAAVLVGELAKVAFSDVVTAAALREPDCRRHFYDVNPLDVLTPVIAAGVAWGHRQLPDVVDDDRARLRTALADGAAAVVRCQASLPMARPVSDATASALYTESLDLVRRLDDDELARMTAASDQAVAAVDGTHVAAELLHLWFRIGVAAATLRSAVDVDSADAVELIRALE